VFIHWPKFRLNVERIKMKANNLKYLFMSLALFVCLANTVKAENSRSLFNFVVYNEGNIVDDVVVTVDTYDGGCTNLPVYSTKTVNVGHLNGNVDTGEPFYQAERGGDFPSMCAPWNDTFYNAWHVSFKKGDHQYDQSLVATVFAKDTLPSPTVLRIGDLGEYNRVYVKVEAPVSGVIGGAYFMPQD
jgi:hypothetical protein